MTKISLYPEIAVPTIDDLLIGTDVENNDTTMNFKISDVLALAGAELLPYKSYVCLLNQEEELDPVATVIYNNIGEVIWTRDEQGSYLATTDGLLTANKTIGFCQVSARIGIPLWQTLFYNDKNLNNEVGLIQFNVNGDYIDELQGTMVEIRVYN
jgi:hypothetical protein